MKVGDVVAVRGDLDTILVRGGGPDQPAFQWIPRYFPEQMVDGKYVKNWATGEIWTGVIKKIFTDPIDGDFALVDGGWRSCKILEVMPTPNQDKDNE